MSEKHLDDAIDRAVREMMNVDAGPAFRARVLARLDRPAPRRMTWPRLAAIGAAMAALVLAIVLTRTSDTGDLAPVAVGQPQAPAPTVARKSEPAPRPAPEPAERTTQRSVAPTERAVPNITQYVPQGALTATVADQESAMPIDALDRIEPIAVAPLDRSPIAPAPIVVAPLTPISELQIAPLFPPSGRD
jgi:hypothetical protein